MLYDVARSLVTRPERVNVKVTSANDITLFVLQVSPEDAELINGVQGRTIASLQTLVSVISARNQRKFRLKMQVQEAVPSSDA
nr:KH domain-containing protein [Granulicella tundricola]